MILQKLVQYYDRLAADPVVAPELPKPGLSRQKLSFCVVLNPDGSLQQFQSMLVEGDRGKPVPTQRLVPGEAKSPGAGINPGFLWDNAGYMLGYKADDPKPERTRESFEAFREKHVERRNEISGNAYHAVCGFLESWTPARAKALDDDLNSITSSFGVFRIAGQQLFVHEEPDVLEFLARENAAEVPGPTRQSLASGTFGPIARLHEPKIKGVQDAQSAGALLVSFNEEAYTSYGKEQSFNAPVSELDAFKYTNALNHLLRRESRPVRLGDATVVFWSERPTRIETFFSDLFGDYLPTADESTAEDQARTDQVRLFLSQLREGHAPRDTFDADDKTRCFILGLAPNAARVSVRFWEPTTVGSLKAQLSRHLTDIELVGARDTDPPLLIRRLIQATGRAEFHPDGRLKSYDQDATSPLLAGAVARAVLTGTRYPQLLLQAMLGRIRADGAINHVRIAAIKAVLLRNARLASRPTEVTVALDRQRSNAGYVAGRLFALLEKIQEDSADGELNATIKDRYYSSASATPGVVFPRLIRLSQHHLGRLDRGPRIFFEKQVGEVMTMLSRFPPHLGIEDQGMFAVGYYHQRQDLFTSKKPKEGGQE